MEGDEHLIVGAGMESLTVTPLQLIGKRKAIQGWPSGTAKDSEETLRFGSLTGVRPMIERHLLDKAADAYRSDDPRPSEISGCADNGGRSKTPTLWQRTRQGGATRVAV